MMRYEMKGLVGRLARQARVMVLFGIIAGLNSSLSMAWQTLEPAQVRGDLPGTTGQFSATPLVTIGEGNLGNSFNLANYGYEPIGLLDGMGAYLKDEHTVRVLANHETGASNGYAYPIGASGPIVTGARISYFDIDRVTRQVVGSGLAVMSAYDRAGALVTSAQQINESTSPTKGFDRFCSANLFLAGEYGLEDTIFMTNEETSVAFGHPQGGSYWALDVATGALWACPDLGRGTWESATFVKAPRGNQVACLLSDDFGPSPMYLYVGTKNKKGNFLQRNGLSGGQLYVWVANDGSLEPIDFNGTGTAKSGRFVPLNARDISQAGQPGYDALGYKNDVTLRNEALALGAFAFSRPEDVDTNPKNSRQVAFASTGSSDVAGDLWGMTYRIDTKFAGNNLKADFTIICDGNETPDLSVRSPDNLAWGDDGMIYIQEDRAVTGFGLLSGIEASMWEVNPFTYAKARIAIVDRAAVPANQTDLSPTDVGNWETSGVIDVTDLFYVEDGQTLLLFDVQAHSIRAGGLIVGPLPGGRNANLAEGGQLLFLESNFEDDDDE
jgi:serralysin